jgi:hypothetical protein
MPIFFLRINQYQRCLIQRTWMQGGTGQLEQRSGRRLHNQSPWFSSGETTW